MSWHTQTLLTNTAKMLHQLPARFDNRTMIKPDLRLISDCKYVSFFPDVFAEAEKAIVYNHVTDEIDWCRTDLLALEIPKLAEHVYAQKLVANFIDDGYAQNDRDILQASYFIDDECRLILFIHHEPTNTDQAYNCCQLEPKDNELTIRKKLEDRSKVTLLVHHEEVTCDANKPSI